VGRGGGAGVDKLLKEGLRQSCLGCLLVHDDRPKLLQVKCEQVPHTKRKFNVPGDNQPE
jgi:hypothetical protein